MKKIKIKPGYVALVDNDDFERLSKFKWYVYHGPHTWYAARYTSGNRKHKMEWDVLNYHGKVGEPCPDHINNHGWDNRKENLRIVPWAVNLCNRRKGTRFASRYMGVTRNLGSKRRPWTGQMVHGQKWYYLGTFATEIEAARAWDRKAVELRGEYAKLNFPVEQKAKKVA